MPTQQQIAEHLDINQSEVSRHMERLGIDWTVATMDAIRVAYLRNLRGQASGHRTDDGQDLVKERVLTERVDRELKQLQLAEKRGLLINVAQLEPELMQMLGAFRAELVARDDKLKDELDALYAIDVDLSILNEHTHAALQQLGRYEPGGGRPAAPPGEEPAAGRALDDDGMGAHLPPPVGEGLRQAGPL